VTPLNAVFAKLFFWRFFSPTAFLFPPKNKLSSQRGLQLLPYKASPIRTSTCTTSPLSSPFFALCVRYVVFEEAEGAALRPPFGLTIVPATYWGVAGVVGVLVPRPGGFKMTCNNTTTGFGHKTENHINGFLW
jgi:hypothetical protein